VALAVLALVSVPPVDAQGPAPRAERIISVVPALT
jgi:hypothetical protein